MSNYEHLRQRIQALAERLTAEAQEKSVPDKVGRLEDAYVKEEVKALGGVYLFGLDRGVHKAKSGHMVHSISRIYGFGEKTDGFPVLMFAESGYAFYTQGRAGSDNLELFAQLSLTQYHQALKKAKEGKKKILNS